MAGRRALLVLLAVGAASCSLGRGSADVHVVEARRVETAPPPTASTTEAGSEPDSPGGSPPPPSSPTGPVTDCAPDRMTPTATGSGDSLFPALGNPGIDVQHYDVDLTVDPSQPLAGTVALDIRMTADRSAFTLDSLGPQVSDVTVDGAAAAVQQSADELQITPAGPLHAGQDVHVVVAYSVDPKTHPGADGIDSGWFTTPGGSYVMNEPDAARTWLPSNDHPSDKATFRFTIHTVQGRTGVANGKLVAHEGDTWVWEERQPMATYLIQLLTGDYDIVDATGPHGLPLTSVVLRADRQRMQPVLDDIGDQIAFFEQYFGPYPLDSYGVAITDSSPGLAMETLGRSLFSRDDIGAGAGGVGGGTQLLTSHELAHQWFGDAVTLGRWRDIWLNESFATYGQWMWFEHLGFGSLESQAESALRARQPGSTADPTEAGLFDSNSYEGGAVVLQALRRTIGDDAFFDVLRSWIAQFDGRSCTTGGFIQLAEQVSGRDLTKFFDTWLFADQPPASFP